MEITEKKQLAISVFSGGAKLALSVGKRPLQEKKVPKTAIRRSEVGGL
jgi:hypothetical protein